MKEAPAIKFKLCIMKTGFFLACWTWLLAEVCQNTPAQPTEALAASSVVWDTPSADSRGSMPLGNGDLGMNVWVETNGDLVFYISKSDAWSDNVAGTKGLPKLGRVRVKLQPGLLAPGGSFSQKLELAAGEIDIKSGPPAAESQVRIWVDANWPVIHVETATAQPHELQVTFESLRPFPEKNLQADTVVTDQPNRVVWFYRNLNRQIPQLTNRTFGAAILGNGLVAGSPTELHSAKPERKQAIAICALTAQIATAEGWEAKLDDVIAQTQAVPLETARAHHVAWWRQFWQRSWIVVGGDAEAAKVTRGYVLQRFVTAAAGRGGAPIKFNGSIFTMDYWKQEKIKGVATNYWVGADARDWGGQYWFQNTRPVYWPLLQSGDFEMMQPLFEMFRNILPNNTRLVHDYYGHDGAYFAETAPFYGGLSMLTTNEPGSYTKHYFTPILELSAMMLDYYDYTRDDVFARKTLLPIANAGVTFFDKHFPRDAAGRLLLSPDNAIEMYWKAQNPAPDIAGLRRVLGGLLNLPTKLTTVALRAHWQELLSEVPPLPMAAYHGSKRLLPAEVYDQGHNFENPELYAIYPFRLFGLHQPNLELAQTTFAARRFREDGCWRQSGIQAALLGDTETARKNVVFVLQRQDPQVRFPAFWAHGSDYVPDEDNGGNGMNALQLMLMQSEGRKIYLLPAWPKTWSASFKLHAPFNTTVEGCVQDGHVQSLLVIPPERHSDVVLPGP